MRDSDDLKDLPPIVPSRDDLDTHRDTRKGQAQQIVRPGYYTEKVKVSTWPVRIVLILLVLVAGAGAGAAYYFYTDLYRSDQQAASRRLDELETRLALMGASTEESDNSLMENINQTIEQYDLLWANWRSNNRKFEDIDSQMAKLALVNEGQDEATANLSQQLADATAQLNASQTRLNTLANEFEQLNRSVAGLNSAITGLQSLRTDMESIRAAMNSGDTTVGGLIGRLEYIEESMESVNAHRLQINETLFRLQENLEAVQRSLAAPGGVR